MSNFLYFYKVNDIVYMNTIGVRSTELTLVDYPPMDDWLLKDNELKSSDRVKQEVKYT